MKRIIKKFFEEAVNASIDGIYFVDRRRKILYWNKASEEITGYKKEEIVNRRCYDNILKHVDESDKNLCKTSCPLVKAVATGKIIEEDVFLHDKNGARIPVHVEAIPVRNSKGEIVGAVERFTQSWGLAQIRENIQQLQKSAFIDPLTQVPNRRYLEQKLEESLDEFKKLGKNSGFIFLDIDNFKHVNDTFGHLAGDKILKAVAQTILSNIKPHDVVGRFGGEEFAVILKDVNEESLKKIASKLSTLIKTSSVYDEGHEISVTVSMGLTLPKESDTKESIIERADSLMYKAKKQGKDRFVFG